MQGGQAQDTAALTLGDAGRCVALSHARHLAGNADLTGSAEASGGGGCTGRGGGRVLLKDCVVGLERVRCR